MIAASKSEIMYDAVARDREGSRFDLAYDLEFELAREVFDVIVAGDRNRTDEQRFCRTRLA